MKPFHNLECLVPFFHHTDLLQTTTLELVWKEGVCAGAGDARSDAEGTGRVQGRPGEPKSDATAGQGPPPLFGIPTPKRAPHQTI